jgi:hypothetical protein
MFIEKLSSGVLCLLTPLGPRYLKPPTFAQRVYFLWMFRNFQTLPLQVLNARQRRLIDWLCAEQHFVALSPGDAWDAPILGTVERRPPIEVETLPPRRPNARASDTVPPLAADVRQRP